MGNEEPRGRVSKVMKPYSVGTKVVALVVIITFAFSNSVSYSGLPSLPTPVKLSADDSLVRPAPAVESPTIRAELFRASQSQVKSHKSQATSGDLRPVTVDLNRSELRETWEQQYERHRLEDARRMSDPSIREDILWEVQNFRNRNRVFVGGDGRYYRGASNDGLFRTLDGRMFTYSGQEVQWTPPHLDPDLEALRSELRSETQPEPIVFAHRPSLAWVPYAAIFVGPIAVMFGLMWVAESWLGMGKPLSERTGWSKGWRADLLFFSGLVVWFLSFPASFFLMDGVLTFFESLNDLRHKIRGDVKLVLVERYEKGAGPNLAGDYYYGDEYPEPYDRAVAVFWTTQEDFDQNLRSIIEREESKEDEPRFSKETGYRLRNANDLGRKVMPVWVSRTEFERYVGLGSPEKEALGSRDELLVWLKKVRAEANRSRSELRMVADTESYVYWKEVLFYLIGPLSMVAIVAGVVLTNRAVKRRTIESIRKEEEERERIALVDQQHRERGDVKLVELVLEFGRLQSEGNVESSHISWSSGERQWVVAGSEEYQEFLKKADKDLPSGIGESYTEEHRDFWETLFWGGGNVGSRVVEGAFKWVTKEEAEKMKKDGTLRSELRLNTSDLVWIVGFAGLMVISGIGILLVKYHEWIYSPETKFGSFRKNLLVRGFKFQNKREKEEVFGLIEKLQTGLRKKYSDIRLVLKSLVRYIIRRARSFEELKVFMEFLIQETEPGGLDYYSNHHSIDYFKKLFSEVSKLSQTPDEVKAFLQFEKALPYLTLAVLDVAKGESLRETKANMEIARALDMQLRQLGVREGVWGKTELAGKAIELTREQGGFEINLHPQQRSERVRYKWRIPIVHLDTEGDYTHGDFRVVDETIVGYEEKEEYGSMPLSPARIELLPLSSNKGQADYASEIDSAGLRKQLVKKIQRWMDDVEYALNNLFFATSPHSYGVDEDRIGMPTHFGDMYPSDVLKKIGEYNHGSGKKRFLVINTLLNQGEYQEAVRAIRELREDFNSLQHIANSEPEMSPLKVVHAWVLQKINESEEALQHLFRSELREEVKVNSNIRLDYFVEREATRLWLLGAGFSILVNGPVLAFRETLQVSNLKLDLPEGSAIVESDLADYLLLPGASVTFLRSELRLADQPSTAPELPKGFSIGSSGTVVTTSNRLLNPSMKVTAVRPENPSDFQAGLRHEGRTSDSVDRISSNEIRNTNDEIRSRAELREKKSKKQSEKELGDWPPARKWKVLHDVLIAQAGFRKSHNEKERKVVRDISDEDGEVYTTAFAAYHSKRKEVEYGHSTGNTASIPIKTLTGLYRGSRDGVPLIVALFHVGTDFPNNRYFTVLLFPQKGGMASQRIFIHWDDLPEDNEWTHFVAKYNLKIIKEEQLQRPKHSRAELRGSLMNPDDRVEAEQADIRRGLEITAARLRREEREAAQAVLRRYEQMIDAQIQALPPDGRNRLNTEVERARKILDRSELRDGASRQSQDTSHQPLVTASKFQPRSSSLRSLRTVLNRMKKALETLRSDSALNNARIVTGIAANPDTYQSIGSLRDIIRSDINAIKFLNNELEEVRTRGDAESFAEGVFNVARNFENEVLAALEQKQGLEDRVLVLRELVGEMKRFRLRVHEIVLPKKRSHSREAPRQLSELRIAFNELNGADGVSQEAVEALDRVLAKAAVSEGVSSPLAAVESASQASFAQTTEAQLLLHDLGSEPQVLANVLDLIRTANGKKQIVLVESEAIAKQVTTFVSEKLNLSEKELSIIFQAIAVKDAVALKKFLASQPNLKSVEVFGLNDGADQGVYRRLAALLKESNIDIALKPRFFDTVKAFLHFRGLIEKLTAEEAAREKVAMSA